MTTVIRYPIYQSMYSSSTNMTLLYQSLNKKLTDSIKSKDFSNTLKTLSNQYHSVPLMNANVSSVSYSNYIIVPFLPTSKPVAVITFSPSNKPNSPSSDSSGSFSNNFYIIIGSISGSVAIILIFSGAFIYCYYFHPKETTKNITEDEEKEDPNNNNDNLPEVHEVYPSKNSKSELDEPSPNYSYKYSLNYESNSDNQYSRLNPVSLSPRSSRSFPPSPNYDDDSYQSSSDSKDNNEFTQLNPVKRMSTSVKSNSDRPSRRKKRSELL